MKSVMVILTFVLLAQTTIPQDITPQTVIDGSKVIMEFIKTFRNHPNDKVKNKEPGKRIQTGDICFSNHSIFYSTVEISRKINDTTYLPLGTILHVSPGCEECILEVSIGIYRYHLMSKIASDSLIYNRQGEFRVCENEKIQHLIK